MLLFDELHTEKGKLLIPSPCDEEWTEILQHISKNKSLYCIVPCQDTTLELFKSWGYSGMEDIFGNKGIPISEYLIEKEYLEKALPRPSATVRVPEAPKPKSLEQAGASLEQKIAPELGGEGAESRWVTVRPRGPGTEGQPVKIMKWGSHWIGIRGMGGKAVGMKFSKIRTKEEWQKAREEAAKKEFEEKTKGKSMEEIEQIRKEQEELWRVKNAKVKELEAKKNESLAEIYKQPVALLEVMPKEAFNDLRIRAKNLVDEKYRKYRITKNIDELRTLAKSMPDSPERDKKLEELIIKEHGSKSDNDLKEILKVVKVQIVSENPVDIRKFVEGIKTKTKAEINQLKARISERVANNDKNELGVSPASTDDVAEKGVDIADKMEDVINKEPKKLKMREIKDVDYYLGKKLEDMTSDELNGILSIFNNIKTAKSEITALTTSKSVENYDLESIIEEYSPNEAEATAMLEAEKEIISPEQLKKYGIEREKLEQANIIKPGDSDILRKHLDNYHEILATNLYTQLSPRDTSVMMEIEDSAKTEINNLLYGGGLTGELEGLEVKTINQDFVNLFGIAGTARAVAFYLKEMGRDKQMLEILSNRIDSRLIPDLQDIIDKAQSYHSEVKKFKEDRDSGILPINQSRLGGYVAKNNGKAIRNLTQAAGSIEARSMLYFALQSDTKDNISLNLGGNILVGEDKLSNLGLNKGDVNWRLGGEKGKDIIVTLNKENIKNIFDKIQSHAIKRDEGVARIKNYKDIPDKNWFPKDFKFKDAETGKEYPLTDDQRRACAFVKYRRNAVIDYGTGMGKEAICYALHAQERESNPSQKTLIITEPLGSGAAITRHAKGGKACMPNEEIHAVTTSDQLDKALEKVKNGGVVTLGYRILAINLAKLKEAGFHTMLADEAHHAISGIKESDEASQQGRAIRELRTKINQAVMLTATPLRNNMIEVAKLINLATPEALDIKEFRQKFSRANLGTVAGDEVFQEMLRRELDNYYIFGRQKEGFPDKKRHEMYINWNNDQVFAMKEAEKEYDVDKISDNVHVRRAAATNWRQKIRNILGNIDYRKNQAVQEMIDVIKTGKHKDFTLAENEPLLFYVQFNKARDTLKEALEANFGKDSVGLIDGELKGKKKLEFISKIQNREKDAPRFVIATPSGQESINLHRGIGKAVWWELPDTYAKQMQGEGRINRYLSHFKENHFLVIRSHHPVSQSIQNFLEDKETLTGLLGDAKNNPNDDNLKIEDAKGYMHPDINPQIKADNEKRGFELEVKA